MPKRNLQTYLAMAVLGFLAAGTGADEAAARYTGTGPACVAGGVDEIAIHRGKSRRSRAVGYFVAGQCGMNVEAVEGDWTYLRGSDRGRNVQGWVRNQFLRAKDGGRGARGRDADNEENNVASAKSCQLFGSIKSIDTGVRVNVRFVNRTNGMRSVMWLDYDGTPKQYKNLNPGESYVQSTFAGHPWMFTDGPGNCKEVFVPDRNSRQYEISFRP